jgi:hypothetical protein
MIRCCASMPLVTSDDRHGRFWQRPIRRMFTRSLIWYDQQLFLSISRFCASATGQAAVIAAAHSLGAREYS